MGKHVDGAGAAIIVPDAERQGRESADRLSRIPTLDATGRRRGFDPRRMVQMLFVSARLGSARARAALTLITFLVIWLLLSIPDAFAATVTRQSSFTYDATDGLLLTETVEPGDAQLGVRTTYAYDAFGNKLSATTANIAGATGNAVIASRSSTATFESNGRFALTTANALGHSESAVTDPVFGVTTSQTGPNGLTTTRQYDSFGRPILEIGPDGNRVAYAYAYCSGVAGGTASCPTYGAYVITTTPQNAAGSQNGPWVQTYYDTHGRAIAADTQGFTGATIRQATEYDALGRTFRQSRPYFLSGGVLRWMTYAYDALGRVISITLADNTASSFGYNGLTTSVTNHLGQTETTVKNARGEIVSVTDANGKTTSYTYDPFGNRTSITDSAGNVQTMTYDKAGRKIAGVDPDLGSWSYAYNVLGELVSQTDAKGQTATMSYDALGRPLSRTQPGLTSNWTYDTATKGIGKLATSSTSAGYLKTLSYDALGRPTTTAIRAETGQATYASTTTYSADSRIDTVAYPSGFTVKYLYGALGHLQQLKNNASSQTFWTANVLDAEMRVTQETAGNGVVTNRTFDQNRGFVTAVQAGPSNAVANLSFTFDAIGNLVARGDTISNVSETFTYDVLNRLTQATIAGGASKTVTYDDLGNITSKGGVGTYTYAAAATPRPHAVIAVSGGTLQAATGYDYDANGNMTAGAGRTLTWTAFNKVASIAKGTTSLSWGYDPNLQRSKQVSTTGGTTNTTWYFADEGSGVMFERAVGPSLTVWNEYLSVAGELIGVHFTRSDSTEATRFFVKDHLGSVAVITNEAGAVAERLAYDAWGKRRNPNGTDDVANILTAQTTRGFTGHEMIDEVDLVNMNGRVYEPTLGRFTSADPFIHEVTNSQDLNRYSYVHNNPLSYTDMNGYGFFKSLGSFLKKIWKPLLAILVAVIFQQYQVLSFLPDKIAGSAFLGGAVQQGITGGITNVIATGKPKAFLLGFGQGFASFGVGHGLFGGVGNKPGVFGFTTAQSSKFGSAGYIGKAVSHGVVGGVFTEIRGGSFKSGFLAAAFSSAATPLEPGGMWQQAAFHTAVGGVGSVLGGGKFADGAVAGAFQYLFNDAVKGSANKQYKSNRQIMAEADALAQEIADEINAQPDKDKYEYGAVIYFDDSGNIVRTPLVTDRLPNTIPSISKLQVSIGRDQVIATVHNHPGGNPYPSDGDKANLANIILNNSHRGNDDVVHGYIVTDVGKFRYGPDD